MINDDSLFNEGDIIVTCDVLGGTLCQDSVQCIGTTKRCKIEQDCNDLSDEKDCSKYNCSLNFIRLRTPSVTTLLRGKNDSKQSNEIQATKFGVLN